MRALLIQEFLWAKVMCMWIRARLSSFGSEAPYRDSRLLYEECITWWLFLWISSTMPYVPVAAIFCWLMCPQGGMPSWLVIGDCGSYSFAIVILKLKNAQKMNMCMSSLRLRVHNSVAMTRQFSNIHQPRISGVGTYICKCLRRLETHLLNHEHNYCSPELCVPESCRVGFTQLACWEQLAQLRLNSP